MSAQNFSPSMRRTGDCVKDIVLFVLSILLVLAAIGFAGYLVVSALSYCGVLSFETQATVWLASVIGK